MKSIAQDLPFRQKIRLLADWCRIITLTGSAQLAIQVIGLISGILVIRLLSTNEYALYTLANTMLGTMLILADGGITNGVLSEGGKVWQNPSKLGSVIVTGFSLRRKFTILSLVVALPVLYALLLDHGATWWQGTLIIAALIPSFFMAMSGSLLEVGPKLQQEIEPLQKIQLIAASGRLFLLSTCLFSLPLSFIALFSAGLPQIYTNKLLKKISVNFTDFNQQADPEVQKNILKVVKRVLPGSIYYCVSGQLTIWLISIFGSTSGISSMGAIGRLSMLLGLFTVLFNTLILPRFARLTTSRSHLLKRFLQMQIGMIVWGLFIVSFFWTFSTEALWVLGSQYRNLEHEVVLNIIGTCLFTIAGINYTLTISRGWAINPLISITVNVATIIVAIMSLNLSTLHGILMLNIWIGVSQVVMNFSYCIFRILTLND
jgi:O-antigen/teichoic acid export membrane protein